MKDHLTDIVNHTHALGFIQLVKIVGNKERTNIEASADDRSVIVSGKFSTPVTDFTGTFGMPNLGKLNTLLGLPEYNKDAEIVVTKKGDVVAGLQFQNDKGDFQNDFRFMNHKQVEELLRTVNFRGAEWNVTFQPNLVNIERFKHMYQANSDENIFDVKTEGTDLIFSVGNHSTHAGEFTFANNVEGTISKEWSYPIAQTLSILNLPGDITMQFSDVGVLQITVNSGMSEYKYMLPAQIK